VGQEQETAFIQIKDAISHPPVLRMANYQRSLFLKNDASAVAFGVVFLQKTDGVRQPIAYASRTLSAQERSASSVYELECLAVLFGTEKFSRYLQHLEFLLETNNKAFFFYVRYEESSSYLGYYKL
jgi:hypothetical protein